MLGYEIAEHAETAGKSRSQIEIALAADSMASICRREGPW